MRMDFIHHFQQEIHHYVTFKNIENLLSGYRELGPLLGILLPMLEAFFPFLPLIVFVLANAAAYGFFLGFLFSWVGTCIGSLIVYLFVRWIARHRLQNLLHRNRKVQSTLEWVDQHGFAVVFFVLAIPFTPSSLINVVAGLSNINTRSFLLAVLLGKMVMIGIVTFIGTDWQNIITDPTRIIPLLVAIALFWLIGKWIEKRMHRTSLPDADKKRAGE